MVRSWEDQQRAAATTLVPWVRQAVRLDGARVVDVCGGAGSTALAFAPHVASVLCLEWDADAAAACGARAASAGLRDVTTRAGGLASLLAEMRARAGEVDIVLLSGALARMTPAERIEVLQVAADVLAPEGVIVVTQTPNRLLWNDYHTTQTPFYGMLPDELALRLAASIRRTDVREPLADEHRPTAERRELLTRFGRGVSHHEFEAAFGRDVHEHVVATGWDPQLAAERPEHREELYLAKFLQRTEPHVAPLFARYWLDLVLHPGAMTQRSLARVWPLHTVGSTGVAMTPAETVVVEPSGELHVDLPGPATRVAIGVTVPPTMTAGGPVVRVRSGGGPVTSVRLAGHQPARWTQHAVVDLAAVCDDLGVSAADGPVEITSVLWWPPSTGRHLGPLGRGLVRTTGAVDPVPAVPAPPSLAAAEGLHGTYVGGDRVFVKLRGGGRLLVSSRDISLMPELVGEGGYDAPFTAFLRRTLTPDSTFVDVGANVGLFTVIGALQAWRGRVIAYEPAAELLPYLRDNVQMNWLEDRVSVRPVAVGGAPGRHAFHFDERLQALGGLSVSSDPDATVVEVVSLDEDLADVGHIDLLKIDVEGGEADVLAGAQRLLGSGRIAAVSCEVRRDALARLGRDVEWERLVASFASMEAAGWTFALIAPDGAELPRTVASIVASEPHPNVVLRQAPVGARGA